MPTFIPTFRGKTPDGRWVEGYHFTNQDEDWGKGFYKKYYIKSKNNGIDFEVLPETIGMSTGKTDKNGKMIFSGGGLGDDRRLGINLL